MLKKHKNSAPMPVPVMKLLLLWLIRVWLDEGSPTRSFGEKLRQWLFLLNIFYLFRLISSTLRLAKNSNNLVNLVLNLARLNSKSQSFENQVFTMRKLKFFVT